MSHLSLSFLGRFRAVYEGEALSRFGSNKVQALLTYLAVETGLQAGDTPPLSHRREHLMELLWPGLLPQSAQNNLRQTIYKLRQLIPTVITADGDDVDFLLSERLTVQLHPQAHYDLDVATFNRCMQQTRHHQHADLLTCPDCQTNLQQAVALYEGEFLADFYLEDSNEFEEWAWNRRAFCRRQVLDALDILTLMTQQQGQYNQARTYAQQQLSIDNLRESAHRQLIEILALSGQPSEALAQYERLRQLLWDELGMAPMAQTTAVYEQIRTGELGVATKSETAVRGYDLQEEIGTGAFGVVYRARQPHVNRDVAVKIIAPDLANEPDFIRRFEVEAQLVARLEHPHIVPLYDYWREPDAAYLVMRYLRGGSLEQILKQGPLPPAKVERLLEQVCAALQVAHQQSIVHRDIKPANILLDEAGNAYLSDFGIAKELGSQRQLTDVGALVGTPDYVSPEQFSDEPVSPASDMYSLGIVLFQMLTGRLPFPEASLSELIYKHLHERIPAISRLRPDLPPAVDDVIWQATAKKPPDRFPTTTAMAAAFHEALRQPAVPGEAFIVPAVPATEVSNPYKGLRPFQEADSDDFFGRESLVHQLVTRLTPTPSPSQGEGWGGGADRFLAIVGPSGSGKSSVVKAGLIPALRQGEIPGSENWFVVEMMPGSHPLEELEAALLHVAVNPPPSLLEPLQKDERGLVRTLKRVLPPAAGDERPQLLLIIDQFEELFTLVEDKEVRQHFIASLIAALNDSRSQLRLVLTLRADFYDRPLQHPELGELLRQCTEVVLPLTLAELEKAIVRPAARMGVRFEPRLAAQMAADVADQPGGLPLLQYALTELFENRHNGTITTAAYETIGGVLGALGRRAEEIYSGLEATTQAATRQLFLRLVTLGEGVEDTRRRVLRSELEALSVNGDPSAVNHNPITDYRTRSGREATLPITDYGNYRLLTFDHDPVTRGPTVEVAHEALLREWGRLRDWLAESRDDVRLQRLLASATSEWLAHEREAGFLLRGSRLDQFAEWKGGTDVALTQDEAAYLAASIAARQQRQAEEAARRQRELETAQQLAQTERHRAEEQAAAAHNLRQRAVYLGLALVVAVLLAIAAGIFSRQSSQNADLAATGEAQALTNLELAQTREAEANTQRAIAETEAEQRAVAQAEAEHQAEVAFARELALAARANLDTDPELSILLSLQSLAVTRTLEAENSLHWAILASPVERTLFHSGGVLDVAYSPDGSQLASAGNDGSVKLWDMASGAELLHIAAHTDDVNVVAFSPDGSRLLSASSDTTVKVWDAHSGEPLLTLEGHTAPVYGAAFSPDGTLLATGSQDGTAKIWDAATGQELLVLPHEDGIWYVTFSPDGSHLATTSHEILEEGALIIWDVLTGEALWSQSGAPFFGVAFNPEGTRLAAEDKNGELTVWDVEDLTTESPARPLFRTFDITTNSGTSNVVFTPDGTALLSLTNDNNTRMWDAATGEELLNLACRPKVANPITLSPDGRHIVTAGESGLIKVCSLAPSQELLTLNTDFTVDVAFAPDSSTLYTEPSPDGTIRAWNLKTERAEAFGQELAVIDAWGGSYDIDVSPDGRLLALAYRVEEPWLWDTVTEQLLFSPEQSEFNALSVAFSPDGSHLAIVGMAGMASIFDVQSGEALLTLTGHTEDIWGVAYSPDGHYLATTGRDGTVKIWDAQSGQELKTIEIGYDLFAVAFSPDGHYLAAAGNEAVIQLWDPRLESEAPPLEIHRLVGHNSLITNVAFSPDSLHLASVGNDLEVKVWDVNRGLELLSLPGHNSIIRGVGFSPDGKWLATASLDGTARLYVVDLDELIDLALTRVTRWWELEECQQYLHTDTCPERPDS